MPIGKGGAKSPTEMLGFFVLPAWHITRRCKSVINACKEHKIAPAVFSINLPDFQIELLDIQMKDSKRWVSKRNLGK